MPQVPRRHVAAGAARPLQALVGTVDLGLGGAGGVAGGAGVAMEEHDLNRLLGGRERLGELSHGARESGTGERQQSGAAAVVPEQIGMGSRGVLAHPVVARDQQSPPAPAAEGGAADGQGRAEGRGLQPAGSGVCPRGGRRTRRAGLAGAVGSPPHGCLPRASSQRCTCQRSRKRRQPGFLGTTWRPSLSRPWRRISKRVERLMARRLQRASVVSQIGSSMAAAAGGCLGQRGRLPRVGGTSCYRC